MRRWYQDTRAIENARRMDVVFFFHTQNEKKNEKKTPTMPIAGTASEARALAHIGWAGRYNRLGDTGNARGALRARSITPMITLKGMGSVRDATGKKGSRISRTETKKGKEKNKKRTIYSGTLIEPWSPFGNRERESPRAGPWPAYFFSFFLFIFISLC